MSAAEKRIARLVELADKIDKLIPGFMDAQIAEFLATRAALYKKHGVTQ